MFPDRCKSTNTAKGPNNVAGSNAVTYVPAPWRVSNTPINTRARTPSRSDPRDTSSSSARSFSTGSRDPAESLPLMIMALIPSTTTSDCERPS
jgi:hypothetical protein